MAGKTSGPDALASCGRLAEWYEPGRDYCYYAASQEACRALRGRIESFRLSTADALDLNACRNMEDLTNGVQSYGMQREGQSRLPSSLRNFTTDFCDFAHQVSALVQPLLPQSPEYSISFGLMSLLFKAVVDKKRQQEKLTAHVESLKAVLPFVDFYETVFPTNQMKMVIAQMYTKVLSFLEEALLYYRSGRLHKLIDAFVQSQEERLEALVGDISAEAARLRSLAEAGHVAQQADMKELMATTSTAVLRMYEDMQHYNSAVGSSLMLLDRKCEAIHLLTETMFAAQSSTYVESICDSQVSSPYEEAVASTAHNPELSARDHWEANGILDVLGLWNSVQQTNSLLWIGGASGNRGSWVTELSRDLVMALDAQRTDIFCVFCNRDEALSAATLAKTLLHQMVTRHADLVYKHSAILSPRRFRQASTFADHWSIVELLAAVVLEPMVLVVDRIECCQNAQLVQDTVVPALVRLAGLSRRKRVVVTSMYEPPDELKDSMQYVYIDTSPAPGTRHHLGRGATVGGRHDLVR